MDHRPVPGENRCAERHHERPEQRGKPLVHPGLAEEDRDREPGDGASSEKPAGI